MGPDGATAKAAKREDAEKGRRAKGAPLSGIQAIGKSHEEVEAAESKFDDHGAA